MQEREEEGEDHSPGGPHSELSCVNNKKFNQEREEVGEDHSPGDPHSELSGVNNEKSNQEKEEEGVNLSLDSPHQELSGVNNKQVPEEEEGRESNESSFPLWVPTDKDYQRLEAHFKQYDDPELTESFEKIIALLSTSSSNNRIESGHELLLRKYLYPNNSNPCTDVGVQADGEQPSLTLTLSHLQDLKLCAKDHQKLAELLESERPSQHLLVVQPKHEQVEALPQGSDPETSFSLTSSDFKTVVEALATDEQKFTRFASLLDLGKDVTVGNDLPLMQRAESIVQHYQRLPESSKEKLLSALYKVGLSLPAEAISLQSKKQ